MIRWKAAVVALGVQAVILTGTAGQVQAQLIPSADGLTAYDVRLRVRWLKNGNLPGTEHGIAGAPAADPGGAMSFDDALAWVAAMNAVSYLGRTTWTLPATPHDDPTCSARGPLGNSFGFACTGSALGSLYAFGLNRTYPHSAVSIPDTVTSPFHNFRPYLYWSSTPGNDNNGNNFRTFSFNTGAQPANVGADYIHVLPMMTGRICTSSYCPTQWIATGVGNLEIPDDGLGLVVYDPDTIDPDTNARGATWVADANLAQSRKFGAQCAPADNVEMVDWGGTGECITPDGAMSHTTALRWIDGMNAFAGRGWLGATSWKLPGTFVIDTSCDDTGHFACTRSPMGKLYYTQLGLPLGTPVVPTPPGRGGNLQPYLYWSCTGSATDPRVCAENPHADPEDRDDPYDDLPFDQFGWSFSFGNGFQGTENHVNHLYVAVYFPQTLVAALDEALDDALGDDPQYDNGLDWLRDHARLIRSLSGAPKERALRTFIRVVNAGRRNGYLTDAEADEIIALARAL